MDREKLAGFAWCGKGLEALGSACLRASFGVRPARVRAVSLGSRHFSHASHPRTSPGLNKTGVMLRKEDNVWPKSAKSRSGPFLSFA